MNSQHSSADSGLTKTDRAFAIWRGLTPMERLEVMRKVPAFKSDTAKFRACIKHIAQELPR